MIRAPSARARRAPPLYARRHDTVAVVRLLARPAVCTVARSALAPGTGGRGARVARGGAAAPARAARAGGGVGRCRGWRCASAQRRRSPTRCGGAITALMTLLFAWVGVGLRRPRRWASGRCGAATVSRPHWPSPHGPIDPAARTAIVMPICNEDIVDGLRRPARHLRVAGGHRRAAAVRRVRAVRHRRPRAARGRAARLGAAVRTMLGEPSGRQRPPVLPLAPAPRQAQGGQRGRLLPSLGAQLPLHGGARRRQHDERRHAGAAGAADGGASARRHHADAAAARATRAPCTRARSSSPAASPAACSRAAWPGGSSARRTTGATTRSCACEPFMRHCGAGALAGPRRPGRRDPVARLRRGGADGPRRLRGLAGAATRRQLGAAARRTCWTNCSATAAGARATCRTLRLVAEPGWRAAHRAMFAVGALSYLVAPLWLGFHGAGPGRWRAGTCRRRAACGC